MLLVGVKGVGKTSLARGMVNFLNALRHADPKCRILAIYLMSTVKEAIKLHYL